MFTVSKFTVESAQDINCMDTDYKLKAAFTGEGYQRRTLASYVRPEVVRMISGARYAGVPTLEPGADWKNSCCSRHYPVLECTVSIIIFFEY